MSKQALSSLVVFPLCVLLLSACVFGGDDDPDTTEAQTATPTTSAGQSIAPTSTPAPVATSSAPIDDSVTVTYVPPFVWPADGPVLNPMGTLHPAGIDIGLDAGGSLTIRAAAGGTVLRAGGGEDEPLGLSVVIEHGNGITTTYGHLSELQVTAGSEVVIGETIGVGGSTGDADGVYLHFEVRQDGQTVDPEDVLPVGASTAVEANVSCADQSFSIPAGSRAQVDLAQQLARDEEVISARAISVGAGRGVGPTLQTRSKVLLTTPIDFDVQNATERYRLELEIQGGNSSRTLTCSFSVEHRNITTTFYAAATSTPEPTEVPEPTEAAEPEDEPTETSDAVAVGEGEEPQPGTPTAVPAQTAGPTPAPTATPVPAFPGGPSYNAPGSANPITQPPVYQAPGNSGPGAQQPSFDDGTGSP